MRVHPGRAHGLVALLPFLGCTACEGEKTILATGGFAPDEACPGGEGCADEGDDVLWAGAAMAEITDEIRETLTVDVDADGEYDVGVDEFADANGNGVMDGTWIAGFGNGRAATGVHDPQWVRAIVLRQNETTIAIVAVDAIGYFRTEIDAIEEALPADLGVDWVSMAATHVHEARDTIGIWGIDETHTGSDPEFDAFVRDQAVAAISAAVDALEPATITYGQRPIDDPEGEANYVSDTRDPVVIDDRVTVLKFDGKDDGETIATLVNFGAHPEYSGSRNTLLSSDFPYWVREGVESGVVGGDVDEAGVGGICVFVNGAVGGQVGPGWAMPLDLDGNPHEEDSFEKAQATGDHVALTALRAIADGETEDTADLAFTRKRFLVPIDNWAYQTMFLIAVIRREIYEFDPALPLDPVTNLPKIETEVGVVRIGRAAAIAMPGEVFPELMIGGYGGEAGDSSMQWDVIETMRDCDPVADEECVRPDLEIAPDPPYLLDRLGGDYPMTWGLSGDMLGYFVPDYDYILHPTQPYFEEYPGDHYEETNSVGPLTWGLIETNLIGLLDWTR